MSDEPRRRRRDPFRVLDEISTAFQDVPVEEIDRQVAKAIAADGSSRRRDAQRTLDRLTHLRERSEQQQLGLIRKRFPDLVADAEAFVRATHQPPWSWYLSFPKAQDIRNRYMVPTGRNHPHPDDMQPLAELFCQTYALLDAAIDRLPPEQRQPSEELLASHGSVAPRSQPEDFRKLREEFEQGVAEEVTAEE